MDLFDRRILARLSRQLPLADGEELLDFDIGQTRPYGYMPPPFENVFQENGRVEIAISEEALYVRVLSKTHKGDVARVRWERLATLGLLQAEGRWRRWSLKGHMLDGLPIRISLNGRPRPSMAATLAQLIDPDPDDT